MLGCPSSRDIYTYKVSRAKANYPQGLPNYINIYSSKAGTRCRPSAAAVSPLKLHNVAVK